MLSHEVSAAPSDLSVQLGEVEAPKKTFETKLREAKNALAEAQRLADIKSIEAEKAREAYNVKIKDYQQSSAESAYTFLSEKNIPFSQAKVVNQMKSLAYLNNNLSITKKTIGDLDIKCEEAERAKQDVIAKTAILQSLERENEERLQLEAKEKADALIQGQPPAKATNAVTSSSSVSSSSSFSAPELGSSSELGSSQLMAAFSRVTSTWTGDINGDGISDLINEAPYGSGSRYMTMLWNPAFASANSASSTNSVVQPTSASSSVAVAIDEELPELLEDDVPAAVLTSQSRPSAFG